MSTPAKPPSVVIDYNAGFKTSGAKLMGANAAAEGFLRAYLRYSGETTFHATVPTKKAADDFRQQVREFAPNPQTPVQVYPRTITQAFAAVGCLYHEDPMLAPLAWQRSWEGETAYSLCGITHTTCTQGALDSFGQLAVAPFYAWDALICTSQSVRSTVERVLTEWSAYLADRLGATRRPAVELPVIPLGVDCESFDAVAADPSYRTKWRAELGIADDDVAFLFFGRLSYHAKAHPFPMYVALESAAQKSQKKLHLILAGWFANETLERYFREGAAQFCPSVKLSVVDGRRLDVRREIWAAADVFTSLSDNIQETFGLTPVEAMAFGLPCVISDWDGYRDTVRHGVDGLRISTSIAPPQHGEVLMRRHFDNLDTYDVYIGHTSHFTAVDIPQTSAAYLGLVENADLRRSLGAAGRQRARDAFDWRVIIGRYQELWTELSRRRVAAAAQPRPRRPSPHPLRPDPFTLFADYATATVAPETPLSAADGVTNQTLEQLYQMPMLQYLAVPGLMATLDELRQIMSAVQAGPQTAGELASRFPAMRGKSIFRGLVWMLKVGLVTRRF